MTALSASPTYEEELLFSRDEWEAAMPGVVQSMISHLELYRTPIFRDCGEYGEGWGSGAYLQLGDRHFVLTNEHVAARRIDGTRLMHQFKNSEELFFIRDNHVSMPWPWDLALLPVDNNVWNSSTHSSRAINIDQIALAHEPAPGELLAFSGFPGAKTQFVFNTLCAECVTSVARECPLPDDVRFRRLYHFGMDYLPDRATSVVGSSNLPLPPGLSGSLVWNTAFVEAKASGVEWSPDLARVTGVLWGWPRDNAGFVIGTRAEHLRSFLLGAPDALGFRL